ncbi:hypothetical protein COO60DRAFT_267023 [Scenedesmus sp. NREL 46B-D3]|nr:hypothetical protein COO60DRAFT_267023 [Scenedesmus sp. NREL 46B-D3]
MARLPHSLSDMTCRHAAEAKATTKSTSYHGMVNLNLRNLMCAVSLPVVLVLLTYRLQGSSGLTTWVAGAVSQLIDCRLYIRARRVDLITSARSSAVCSCASLSCSALELWLAIWNINITAGMSESHWVPTAPTVGTRSSSVSFISCCRCSKTGNRVGDVGCLLPGFTCQVKPSPKLGRDCCSSGSIRSAAGEHGVAGRVYCSRLLCCPMLAHGMQTAAL